MNIYKNYIDIIKREVIPALGCTEPIAVAYAVAKATDEIGTIPDSIELNLSANIIKNALGVGLPGIDTTGIDIVSVLGAICNNSKEELNLLSNITDKNVEFAKKYIEKGKVTINNKLTGEKLYIEAICKKNNDYAKVIIQGNHTNITLIEKNNEIIFKKEYSNKCGENNEENIFTIKDIYEFINEVDVNELKFLLRGIDMNLKVSEEGIENKYGLQVGSKMSNHNKINLLANSLTNKIISGTAAASDARMAGCKLPIMTVAGSGNQGITCILPATIFAKETNIAEEKLLRAIALSILITVYIKSYMGRISPLCGAGIAASTGAGASITYLSGGNLNNIKCLVKNMIADIYGMICDGAKSTCALKIATGIQAAIQCSILAMHDIEPTSNDGIINDDVDKSIKSLGNLLENGFNNTDNAILEIMLDKKS
ncbi:serine dehydratase subunit alpha family protein [Clostridium tarantellae]|uniref:L-cysteine desulfidase family protein n=1 Tax=Clostridium tarantellae TaxID=39493 RepID=UPI00128B840A|nr:L-serine ammonia-lyase, iron-sulfur-dependent, subunit alpha [Clostridium tarantellae]